MNKFLLSVAAMAVVATACSDDDDNDITGPVSTREYVQIERLGNPLVSEVFFLKCFWPEFDLWHFLPVLVEWQWRQKQNARDERPRRRVNRRRR